MTKTNPRVVSLLSSNTEMVAALGREDLLVGISHECDWPPAVTDRPRLTFTRVRHTATSREIHEQVGRETAAGASLYEINEAELIALRPDVILTQAQCEVCAVDYDEVAAAVARMNRPDPPRVLSFQPETLDDVLRDLGTLAGELGGASGDAAVSSLRARIDRVRATSSRAPAASETPPAVLMLEWLDPPMPGGCWTPELIETAGGLSPLAARGEKTRTAEWSEIARCGAEVIVLAPCGFKIDQTLREADDVIARPEIAGLPAAAAGRIFIADGNALFNRPGPRLVDTLELLAHMIRPEAAAAAGIPFPEGMALRRDPANGSWTEAGPCA